MGALLSRLAKVEAKLFDPFGKRRGGVLWVPPIMSIDEWEVLAMRQQAELVAACMEDTHARTVHSARPEWSGAVQGISATHTPDPHRRQEARPALPPTPRNLPRVTLR